MPKIKAAMNRSTIHIIPFIVLIVTFTSVRAQDEWSGECTSIMVGRLASTDGSVITSHTCDGTSHTWVSYVPASDHAKGETTPIRKEWRRTRFVADTVGIKVVGQIPQVRHTYAYLNTGYPSLNEKQVGIGETTFVGPDTLVNKDSPLLIEELCRLALERCDNARDAVRTMGSIAEKYGYGDVGECLTVADKREVWQFEITGVGKTRQGAAWVAQRIPDDEVGISANIPRIGRIDRRNRDFFMASDNLEQTAIDCGLWDGKGEFVYWKVYLCDYAKGKNFREREFRVFSLLAPSLNLSFEQDEIPFSVKPDSLVDVRKVMALFRDTYEGTQFDMCRNVRIEEKDKKTGVVERKISPVANPWLTKDMRETLNTICSETVEFHRTLSVAWCAYSTVIQLRGNLPDGIGGICWYSVDNPSQSPRIPLFCGGNALPEAFSRCGHKSYDPTCVLWRFRRANKLATIAWQKTKKEFWKDTLEMEDLAFSGLDSLEREYLSAPREKRAEVLNRYTASILDACSERWNEMEARYWHMFGRGF